mgnify:CR=1 FL=1
MLEIRQSLLTDTADDTKYQCTYGQTDRSRQDRGRRLESRYDAEARNKPGIVTN